MPGQIYLESLSDDGLTERTDIQSSGACHAAHDVAAWYERNVHVGVSTQLTSHRPAKFVQRLLRCLHTSTHR